MNQVERWFGLLTDKLIRRGVHTSAQALENDIREWIATWNDNPRPFKQAVAFVRQRRDYVHRDLNFTDLDRARRQQAFIISMTYQLKQGGAFTNPAQCAKQNTAPDSHLDLLNFAKQASNLTAATSPS
jgi:hypothetical protein